MKQIMYVLAVSFLVSCGASTKEKAGGVNDKKASLQKLKNQQLATADEIKKLEEEIAKEDPSFGVKPKLVAVTPIALQNFTHYIDLQGKISTENIYYVTPRGMGGQVKAIYVKEGQFVKKGQLVLKLDDAIMLQNLKQLETQQAFAQNIYNRQKNLWDQGIGTEVQLITAKNNVQGLEDQIKTLREQWSTSNVYAEVSGIVETVGIKVGETFTGSPMSGISIVNTSDLKAVVDVPETYVSSVKRGTPVLVEVPDINQKFNTSVNLISQLINPNSRGFMAEAKMPSSSQLKPNQIAIVKIQDYAAKNAVIIPLTVLQTDGQGKYVYILTNENGKKIARKKNVVAGSVYGELIEIKSGLQEGEQLISSGFQDIYDGQLLQTNQ
jgi:membrane fusion protein, multidrug efflux system